MLHVNLPCLIEAVHTRGIEIKGQLKQLRSYPRWTKFDKVKKLASSQVVAQVWWTGCTYPKKIVMP